MTARDVENIKKLHYIDNYPYRKIAIIFGVCHSRIQQIIKGNQLHTDTTFVDTTACKLCNSEGSILFYIDGNEENNRKANLIWLCTFHVDFAKRNIEKKKKPINP